MLGRIGHQPYVFLYCPLRYTEFKILKSNVYLFEFQVISRIMPVRVSNWPITINYVRPHVMIFSLKYYQAELILRRWIIRTWIQKRSIDYQSTTANKSSLLGSSEIYSQGMRNCKFRWVGIVLRWICYRRQLIWIK